MKLDLTQQDAQILLQLLDAAGKHIGLAAYHDCHRFAVMVQAAAQAEQAQPSQPKE